MNVNKLKNTSSTNDQATITYGNFNKGNNGLRNVPTLEDTHQL